jgi:cytochrome c peroxidase
MQVFGSRRFFHCLLTFLLLAGSVCRARGELSSETQLGRRLFAEPRFAQFFYEHCGGRPNATLVSGDPALDILAFGSTESGPIKNVSAGQSVSCATCHLGGEYRTQVGLPAGGVSLFGDFASRSPVTKRSDLHLTAMRNASSLVGLTATSSPGWGLLHWDGEFTSLEDLIAGTFTGRNLGWLPDEQAQAQHHFARIIREDDGNGDLARNFGRLPYATLLRGDDATIPDGLRLGESFRIDPAKATDGEILRGCARLVAEYISSLQLSRDKNGIYTGSPYDAFLGANHLPRAPNPGEVPAAYARRLHAAIAALKTPRFIDDPARKLHLHDQPFRFGELELRGLRIFFRGSLGYGAKASAGNCAECHVPPHFTDASFHNTGEAQMDYDAVYGTGAFVNLIIPSQTERRADYDRWLPPTFRHPQGSKVFLSPVSLTLPGQTDLGLWNVYGNPDLPAPQPVIERKLNYGGRLSGDDVLALTIGRFKTPSVRDLGQSTPYLHTGRLRTLEEVVTFYQRASDLAHAGALRNAPPEFSAMRLEAAHIAPLVAFLRSLNEDYQ